MDTRATRVLLVEASDRVLGAFPPSLSRSGEKQLRSLGVTPMLEHDGRRHRRRRRSRSRRRDGTRTRIPARTMVWAAGVAASPLAGLLADAAGAETDRAGGSRSSPT